MNIKKYLSCHQVEFFEHVNDLGKITKTHREGFPAQQKIPTAPGIHRLQDGSKKPKGTKISSTFHLFWWGIFSTTKSGRIFLVWCFQPILKNNKHNILVKWDHFPKVGIKIKSIWNLKPPPSFDTANSAPFVGSCDTSGAPKNQPPGFTDMASRFHGSNANGCEISDANTDDDKPSLAPPWMSKTL